MNEHVFRYGENSRGFGILTIPDNLEKAPVIVLLNAGVLHRSEPYRLNVLAGRRFAEIGYISLRVDLSGNGDTPSRKNLSSRESLNLDWKCIKQALDQQFGERSIIIFGLCAGADNGMKIAAWDTAVRGLILLDAVSKKDSGFARREFLNKITNTYKWKTLSAIVRKKIAGKLDGSKKIAQESSLLRDEPTEEDMRQCLEGLIARNGRVLTIFSRQASSHYNTEGQFCRAMAINNLDTICEEVFWPNVSHLYNIQVHRDRLLKKLDNWSALHLEHFRQ